MTVCPRCNTQQPHGLNYCIKCGNPFGAESAKKKVPTKGLLLGGCGCAVLIAVAIGVIVVIAIIMMNIQGGGGHTPQPPVVQPQPTAPTQPSIPTGPTLPTVPTSPSRPQVDTYPDLKQEEFMIRFAKDLTPDGNTIGATTEFSTNDPQIVQVVRWGPDTVRVGALVMWGWYYNGTTFV